MTAPDPQRDDTPPARVESLSGCVLDDDLRPGWTDNEPAALAFLQSFTRLSRQTPRPHIVSAFQRLERALAVASLKSPAQAGMAGEAWYAIARALHVPETLQQRPDLARTAATAYQRALDLHCSEAQCCNNLGNLHRLYLQQPQPAEECYLRAIALDPRTPTPHIGLGDLYHHGPLHQPARAEAHYLTAIALDATYWYPHLQLADLYQRHLHRYAEAEAHYLRALELSPDQVWAHCGLGRLCHYHLHQYPRAEAHYLHAIRLAPQLAFPHRELGNLCHYHLHQPARAEECYQRALQLHPQDAYALRTLGALYQDHLHQPQRAEECYHRAHEADPANPRPHTALGHFYESLGQWEQATTSYQRALSLDARHAPAHRGLAWVALRSRDDLAAARRSFAQAEASEASEVANAAAASSATAAAGPRTSPHEPPDAAQAGSALLHIALATWAADWPQAHALWEQWITRLPSHAGWYLWQNRDRIAALLRRTHAAGQSQPLATALHRATATAPAASLWHPFAALKSLQHPAPAPDPPSAEILQLLQLLQTPDPPADAGAPSAGTS